MFLALTLIHHSSAQYKGDLFRISFNGKLNKDLLDGKLISTDEKLQVIKVSRKNSKFKFKTGTYTDFTAQIFQANLKDLGLSKQNYVASPLIWKQTSSSMIDC